MRNTTNNHHHACWSVDPQCTPQTSHCVLTRLTAPLDDKEIALVRYGLRVLEGRPDKWELLHRLLLPQRTLVTITRQWANARRERPQLADLSDKPGPPPGGPFIPDDWRQRYPYEPRSRTHAVDYGIDANGKKKGSESPVWRPITMPMGTAPMPIMAMPAMMQAPAPILPAPMLPNPIIMPIPPILPPHSAPTPPSATTPSMPTPLAAVRTPPAALATLTLSTRRPSSTPPSAKRSRLEQPETQYAPEHSEGPAPVRPMEALAVEAMRQLATPPQTRRGAANHVGAWTTEENRLIMEELADVSRLDASVCRAVWVAYTGAYGTSRRSYEEVLLQAGWLFERWLEHMAGARGG